MRARVETLRHATPFDDERFRAHRTRDDAVSSGFRINRALAGDENFLAKMLFERYIVVMTIDSEFGFERLSVVEHFVKDFNKRFIMISRFFIA